MKKILSLMLAVVMVFSFATVALAAISDYDYAMTLGADSYEVVAGGSISIPVYAYNTTSAEYQAMCAANIAIPSEFTIESTTAGLAKSSEINIDGQVVKSLTDNAENLHDSNTPVLTINLVAPTTAGTYVLSFVEADCFLFDVEYLNVVDDNGYTLGYFGTTITVTAGGEATTAVVCDGKDYSGNAFTVTDTKATFTMFAKATNAEKFGIMLGTEAFTKENIKEKNVWVLEATAGKNADDIFAVEVTEERVAGASFTKLTSASVWACAYAINNAGEYVISEIIEY